MEKNIRIVLVHLLNKADPTWRSNPDLVKALTNKSFDLPTVQEVEEYLRSINIRDAKENANRFFNFYESKGWMVGKNKMKNWKAAIKTWKFEKEDKGLIV